MQIVIRADQEKRHGDPVPQTKSVGEAKIDAGGDVKLPDDVLRAVDWKQGDQLWVTVVDGDHVVLSKRPEDIVEYFAGAFTHLYPDPEDTRRFLDEGCGYGDDSDPETEA